MNSILHEVWINAERSTVFDAITTRNGLDAWWGKAVQAEPEPATWSNSTTGSALRCR